MKVSDKEEVADHLVPESWVGSREGSGQALTGESVGMPLSCEIMVSFRTPTPLAERGRQHHDGRKRESVMGPAQSKTHRMQRNTMPGTLESPQLTVADGAAVRSGKANGRSPDVYGCGQSYEAYDR